jgi:predicted metal-dependent phosphotriesterase family hydrolase
MFILLFSSLTHTYRLQEAEREKLETIRTMMVDDMRTKGVDEKYFGEMLTLDIKKILSH